MQQQLKEMQDRIDAQLRKRSGGVEPQRGPSKALKATRGKRAATSKASEQMVEASEKLSDEVESPIAEGNGARSDSGDLDLVLEERNGCRAAKPAIEDTDAAIEEPNLDASGAPAILMRTHTNKINELAPSTSSEKTMTEAELGNNTIAKATVEKLVDQVVDAALTPPSDVPKYGDDLLTEFPAVKPTSNGVETPETTIADQATSPVEAETMEIDAFDLE